MPVNREPLPASAREPAESLPQSTAPTACLVLPCAELRSDNRAKWPPAQDACSGPAGPTRRIFPSTPSLPAEDAGPYAAETWLADALLAADPAWPPLAPGQDRAMLPSLHPAPTPQSDRRSGDCAPASEHPAGWSLPDPRASSEPATAPPHCT